MGKDLENKKKTDNPTRSLNHGHRDGKPRWTLLYKDFRLSLQELLKCRAYGAEKYERENCFASANTEDHDQFLEKNMDSIYRHLDARNTGEFLDVESSPEDVEKQILHMAMVAQRALIDIEFYLRKRNALLHRQQKERADQDRVHIKEEPKGEIVRHSAGELGRPSNPFRYLRDTEGREEVAPSAETIPHSGGSGSHG